MNCGTCGAAMNHYENPDRWVCPREGTHAAILAQQRSAGTRNKGQARPKSKDNLPRRKGGGKK